MSAIILGGASFDLPPVTIGRLEAINSSLLADGDSHIVRCMNVINAALPQTPLNRDSEVTLNELTEAMKAVLVHAGFKAEDPKAEPLAAA